MPTLPLIITDAGRQAIVDATNTGTLPVVLSQVALGTGTWAPDTTAVALQAELKRINTIGGLVVAADTIHVTITDASTDAYALGEFGLYTDGGVLFAIYSELAGITDKAADALLLLANDIVLTSVPAGSVTVGGTEFTNPLATETVPGIAEVATQTETDTGTDDARLVTPKKLMAAATSAATANKLMRRDASGRAKVAAPSAVDDIARKDTVDAVQTSLNSHASLTAPHSATSAATADRLMLRDASGRAKVAAPSAADDIARKDTVDNAVSGLGFPVGTIMLFAQSAAPTGWTKLTDHNDKALRVVSGTASSGGSSAFSAAFAARTVSSVAAGGSVGSTTLTTNQIPAHSHTARSGNGTSGVMSTSYTYAALYYVGDSSNAINNAGGGYTHSHSFLGTAHSHTLDMAVQYVDVIRAQKG